MTSRYDYEQQGYRDDRQHCAQTRLGESHAPHGFEYRIPADKPGRPIQIQGGYHCDGLEADCTAWQTRPVVIGPGTAGHPPIPDGVFASAGEAVRQAYLKRSYDAIDEQFGTHEGCGGIGTLHPCGGCKDCAGARVAAYMPGPEVFAEDAAAVVRTAASVLWREWTAGKAVVDVPEPDNGDCWYVGESDIHGYQENGDPAVCHNLSTLDSYPPGEARALAAVLLAAADRAEQLADEAGAARQDREDAEEVVSP